MGWDNPPVPWREFERRLSWGTGAKASESGESGSVRSPDGLPRPVTRLPAEPDPQPGPPWAELHCHSSYSFLDGASSPSDLVREAAARGLSALAITDHDGMYGVPQFAQAAARLRADCGTASASAPSSAPSSASTACQEAGPAFPTRPADTCWC
jgi:error-prone DNA polymerase